MEIAQLGYFTSYRLSNGDARVIFIAGLITPLTVRDPLHPGGMAEMSRRLSAATPPDQHPKTFLASRRDASTSSCPRC
ncbi:MAG: hypothetical protein ACK6DB_14125, partial [Planctomycetota bacterium]